MALSSQEASGEFCLLLRTANGWRVPAFVPDLLQHRDFVVAAVQLARRGNAELSCNTAFCFPLMVLKHLKQELADTERMSFI